MGFFDSSVTFKQNPFMIPGLTGLQNFADNVGFGRVGNQSNALLKQMMKGNYSGIIGGMLNPITQASDTGMREALRNMNMNFGLGMGNQPLLNKNMEATIRAQFNNQKGEALANAIPQLYNTMASNYQNALNSQRGYELGGLSALTSGEAQSAVPIGQSSTLQKILGGAGGLASLFSLI